jgi:hypothetical protein
LRQSGIRALKSCLYISGERSEREKEGTLIHMTCIRVVSEWEKSSLCSGSRKKQITPCHPEEKGSHLIEKTGMPEEEEGGRESRNGTPDARSLSKA